MRITTVSATLRYSAEAKRAWRSIEVGAEATLTSSDENWQTAQTELYQKLGRQLKALWSNGTDKVSTEEQPLAMPPIPDHWCDAHQTEFKRQSKGNAIWYSHRTGSSFR